MHVHAEEALEVEFVSTSGRTLALRTLAARDVRPVGDDDLLAVRPAVRGAA